jgi:hypothetical protein
MAAAAKNAASTAARALKKLSIDNVPISQQRVLIRVDFNVPQDKVWMGLTTSAT